MAWQVPTFGIGFEEISRFSRRLDRHRSHPHTDPTSRKILFLLNYFESDKDHVPYRKILYQ